MFNHSECYGDVTPTGFWKRIICAAQRPSRLWFPHWTARLATSYAVLIRFSIDACHRECLCEELGRKVQQSLAPTRHSMKSVIGRTQCANRPNATYSPCKFAHRNRE